MRAPRSGVTLDILRMAFDTLRAHRLRSGLTVFGVVIGVLVVVVVSSILTGMRRNVIQAVEEYGTNNIFAFHLTTGPQLGSRDRSEFRRKPLRPEDGAAVRELAPAIEDVAHCAFLWVEDRTITYGREKYQRAALQAVSANYAEVTNLSLREGRFLVEGDDEHRRPVLVHRPQRGRGALRGARGQRDGPRGAPRGPAVHGGRACWRSARAASWARTRTTTSSSCPTGPAASSRRGRATGCCW